MATLPDWTADPAGPPQPAFRRVQPDMSGRILEQGFQSLGTGLEKSADEVRIQQVNMARAQASNALLDHEIQVKTTAEQINQDVADGKLDYNEAPQKYNEAVSKIPQPQIANLDSVGQENLQRGLTRNVFTSGVAVNMAAATARRNDFKDQFTQNLDKLGTLAGMPNADIQGINDKADAFAPLAREAGVPQGLIDTALTRFKEQNWFNNATQRLMEAKEDPAALKQLQHDLVDADGFFVGRITDTAKRDVLLGRVQQDQLILENRAEHLQDKREAKAFSAVNQINEQISSGVPATPAMWENWENMTRGTMMEPEFKQALNDETTVQKVLRMPVDQQVAFVQQKQSTLDTEGGSLRDKANLMRLQTAVNQNVRLMTTAPLLFSANRNGTDIAPLDLSHAATPDGQAAITAQVNDRMNTITALRKQYGSAIALNPLLPQEAGALATQLNQSTPKDRYSLLTALSTSFQNDDAFQAAMRQVAPHSPVTAIVGSRVGQAAPANTPVWFNRNFTMSPDDAQLVLKGEALLNPPKAETPEKGTAQTSTFPMSDKANSGQTLQQVFGKAAQGLFPDRPQLADAHFAMFRAAYAGLLAQSGNMKGTADPKIEQKALDIALGSRAQHVDVNGSTVRVPDGMDPSIFNGAVRNAVLAVAKTSGAPDDWQDRMRGYQLREIGGLGSGQYKLTSGGADLVRPDGKGLFVIDLQKQYIPRVGAETYQTDTTGQVRIPQRGNPALLQGGQ